MLGIVGGVVGSSRVGGLVRVFGYQGVLCLYVFFFVGAGRGAGGLSVFFFRVFRRF